MKQKWKKNVNILNEYSRNKMDIVTYYIKDKSRGIYKKVNIKYLNIYINNTKLLTTKKI